MSHRFIMPYDHAPEVKAVIMEAKELRHSGDVQGASRKLVEGAIAEGVKYNYLNAAILYREAGLVYEHYNTSNEFVAMRSRYFTESARLFEKVAQERSSQGKYEGAGRAYSDAASLFIMLGNVVHFRSEAIRCIVSGADAFESAALQEHISKGDGPREMELWRISADMTVDAVDRLRIQRGVFGTYAHRVERVPVIDANFIETVHLLNLATERFWYAGDVAKAADCVAGCEMEKLELSGELWTVKRQD